MSSRARCERVVRDSVEGAGRLPPGVGLPAYPILRV